MEEHTSSIDRSIKSHGMSNWKGSTNDLASAFVTEQFPSTRHFVGAPDVVEYNASLGGFVTTLSCSILKTKLGEKMRQKCRLEQKV